MVVSRITNLLRGSDSSKRIFDAVRNSFPGSSQQSPLSTAVKSTPLRLRCFSSAGNGGAGDAEKTTSQGAPHEPQPDRPLRGSGQVPPPFNPNRKSRFDSPEDDNSFLEKFKLGVSNLKDQRAENPRREEAKSPSVATPPENADEIFKRMKENGLIPNAVAMLDGLCQDGLVQEALKLFGLMREKGTIPDVVVYTAVVDGFCKAQKLDDAVRIFRKMQRNGILPNAFSYGVLVQGLCKCKRFDEALEFCLEMLEAGCSPNVATFVGLVDGWCEAKGVEEAGAVIAKLREKGFLLNEKAVRVFLEKKAVFSPAVWEAIFGKKASQKRLF